jgi:hypothetical protein
MKAKINSSDLFAGLDDMPVRLDEEFEEERKYQEEQVQREQEYAVCIRVFTDNHLSRTFRLSRLWKL